MVEGVNIHVIVLGLGFWVQDVYTMLHSLGLRV